MSGAVPYNENLQKDAQSPDASNVESEPQHNTQTHQQNKPIVGFHDMIHSLGFERKKKHCDEYNKYKSVKFQYDPGN